MPNGEEIYFDSRIAPDKKVEASAHIKTGRFKTWWKDNWVWAMVLVMTIWLGGVAPLIQAFH